MADVKNILKFIHVVAVTFWGLNFVELLKINLQYSLKTDMWLIFEDTIKLFMAIAGLVYFILKIINTQKSNKLDRILKQQQIDKNALENLYMIEKKPKKKKK